MWYKKWLHGNEQHTNVKWLPPQCDLSKKKKKIPANTNDWKEAVHCQAKSYHPFFHRHKEKEFTTTESKNAQQASERKKKKKNTDNVSN